MSIVYSPPGGVNRKEFVFSLNSHQDTAVLYGPCFAKTIANFSLAFCQSFSATVTHSKCLQLKELSIYFPAIISPSMAVKRHFECFFTKSSVKDSKNTLEWGLGCCRHEVSFIQVAYMYDKYSSVWFAKQRQWHIDPEGGLFHADKVCTSTKPGIIAQRQDVPGQKVIDLSYKLVQKFDTCAVCSKGLNRGAVYGCARWGHRFSTVTSVPVTDRFGNVVGMRGFLRSGERWAYLGSGIGKRERVSWITFNRSYGEFRWPDKLTFSVGWAPGQAPSFAWESQAIPKL